MLTLQETRSNHDFMNRPKMNLLLILTFYYTYQNIEIIHNLGKKNSFVFNM